MKTHPRLPLTLLCLAMLAALAFSTLPAQAAAPLAGLSQQEASPAPTQPAAPPEPTNDRPLILVQSYSASLDPLEPGRDFNLTLLLGNNGNKNAFNIVVTYTPGDLIPVGTGGTQLVRQIIPGETKGINQGLIASPSLAAGAVANLVVNITYNDQDSGAAYSASFNIALHVKSPNPATAAKPTATPTAAPILRPQLAITGYSADVDPLQPGLPFNLKLDVRNLGNADARSVSVIMGGGSASGGQSPSGTQEPGGIAGGSGEFTNFAPLRASNIQYIGDVASGQSASTAQSLIVNTNTNPGAYPVKFSFVYQDAKGARFVDDQVITLLVYSLPLVEVNFYRDPGSFMVGQPGMLPIQIVNLSRKPVVLGNMKANLADPALGQLMNNTTLVSAMDPGGYFTLDAQIIPNQPGPLEITVDVSYTDDFNQPQTISQKLNVTVMEAPVEPIPSGNPGDIPGDKGGIPGGSNGGIVTPTNETLWDKVVRFVKGLIGLDSSVPQPSTLPGGIPTDGSSGPAGPAIEKPMPAPAVPVPAPAKGG